MRRLASAVTAVVVAAVLAGTAASAPIRPETVVTSLAAAGLTGTSHPGSPRSVALRVPCWKTWQSVRDALLHHTSSPGCVARSGESPYHVVSATYHPLLHTARRDAP